jgi:hypothetical protein
MKSSKSNKTLPAKKSRLGAMQESQVQNNARNRMPDLSGDTGRVDKGGMPRTMGAATKDAKHGLHTDHGTSRRSESRRDGSMGRESKMKMNRKNV